MMPLEDVLNEMPEQTIPDVETESENVTKGLLEEEPLQEPAEEPREEPIEEPDPLPSEEPQEEEPEEPPKGAEPEKDADEPPADDPEDGGQPPAPKKDTAAVPWNRASKLLAGKLFITSSTRSPQRRLIFRRAISASVPRQSTRPFST